MSYDPIWGNIQAASANGTRKVLLAGVTSTVVGTVVQASIPAAFQFWISGTSGAISATVKLWASNDDNCLVSQSTCAKTLLATTSGLSGTGTGIANVIATDQWINNAPYTYYWAEVSAISGTGTAVSAKVAF